MSTIIGLVSTFRLPLQSLLSGEKTYSMLMDLLYSRVAECYILCNPVSHL